VCWWRNDRGLLVYTLLGKGRSYQLVLVSIPHRIGTVNNWIVAYSKEMRTSTATSQRCIVMPRLQEAFGSNTCSETEWTYQLVEPIPPRIGLIKTELGRLLLDPSNPLRHKAGF